MRSRRPSAEHQEVVSRRLALLSAELAGARAAEGPSAEPPSADSLSAEPPAAAGWYDDHTRVRPTGGATPEEAIGPPVPVVRSGSQRGWPDPPPPPPRESRRPAPAGSLAPQVPVPGRHAARRARRPGEALAALLPETLQGRVAIGSAQLTVVSLVVALGLAVTCWWVVRSDPGVPAAPAPVDTSPVAELVEVPAAAAAASPGASVPPAPAGSAGAAVDEVVVDVAGRVRRPGVVVLAAGSRVVDALEAAGGARPGVDLSDLNLARVLVDGEQVRVGTPAVAPATVLPGASSASGGATTPAPLLDLNTATEPQLETLPQVGPVTAAAIVAWRTEHGGFSAVDELLEVDGIGEATLAQVAPHVTVSGG